MAGAAAILKQLKDHGAIDKIKVLNEETEETYLHHLCKAKKHEILALFLEYINVNLKNQVSSPSFSNYIVVWRDSFDNSC